MAEVESTKYTDETKDKSNSNYGRFNQPPEFHPNRSAKLRREPEKDKKAE